MTRINSNINPKRLTDEHLRAEIRELPRIPSKVKTHLENGKTIDELLTKAKSVSNFKLGTGHVIFFYDKILFLLKRYELLLEEYKKRYSKNWNFESVNKIRNDCHVICKEYGLLYNDWESTFENDMEVVKRINDRIISSKQTPHYNKEIISKEQAISIITNIK